MGEAAARREPFILIVSGSTQEGGQSLKVAEYFQLCLADRRIASHLLNLFDLDLPLFGLHNKRDDWRPRWQAAAAEMAKADGVILISPEYNGSASPAVLNLMLHVGDQLAHKPVLPVGVSAGRGGAYPLANLRQNGFKDPGYVVLPTDVIVSHVGRLLNDQAPAGPADRLTDEENELRRRIDHALAVLLAYARALRGVDLLFKS